MNTYKEKEKNSIYMLWFKFILGLMFFELVSILLLLFQIMVINTWQKKMKIEPVWKILHQTKFKP